MSDTPRPSFSTYKQAQPNYQALDFTDDELDTAYSAISPQLRETVNQATLEALSRQGMDNVRPGSNTWLKAQRKAMLSMLCEAEDRERDSELG